MSLARRWFSEGICWGAAVLFVLVALPIAALATILLRAVLFVGAVVAGLGVAVTYCANSRFRSWVNARLCVLDSVPLASGRK